MRVHPDSLVTVAKTVHNKRATNEPQTKGRHRATRGRPVKPEVAAVSSDAFRAKGQRRANTGPTKGQRKQQTEHRQPFPEIACELQEDVSGNGLLVCETDRSPTSGPLIGDRSLKSGPLVSDQSAPTLAPTSKECRSCGQSKPSTAFSKHNRSADGHRHDCKNCVADGRGKRALQLTAAQTTRDREWRKQPKNRRVNRQAVSNWQARNPHAVNAKKTLHAAVKKGRVLRAEKCQAAGCETERVEGHHFDYDRPLDVGWFCPKHHRRLHAGVRFDLKCGVDPLFAGLPELF